MGCLAPGHSTSWWPARGRVRETVSTRERLRGPAPCRGQFPMASEPSVPQHTGPHQPLIARQPVSSPPLTGRQHTKFGSAPGVSRAQLASVPHGRAGSNLAPPRPVPSGSERRTTAVRHPSQDSVAPGGQLTNRGRAAPCPSRDGRAARAAIGPGRLGRATGRLSESLASTCEPSIATTDRLAACAIPPRSSPRPPPHRLRSSAGCSPTRAGAGGLY